MKKKSKKTVCRMGRTTQKIPGTISLISEQDEEKYDSYGIGYCWCIMSYSVCFCKKYFYFFENKNIDIIDYPDVFLSLNDDNFGKFVIYKKIEKEFYDI